MLLLHPRATQADSCLRGIHLALHMWAGLDEALFLRFYEPQSDVCVVQQRCLGNMPARIRHIAYYISSALRYMTYYKPSYASISTVLAVHFVTWNTTNQTLHYFRLTFRVCF